MTTALYNYTYTSPDGYSYKGQVVADTEHSQYLLLLVPVT